MINILMNTGAIVGIVIGAVVLILIIVKKLKVSRFEARI